MRYLLNHQNNVCELFARKNGTISATKNKSWPGSNSQSQNKVNITSFYPEQTASPIDKVINLKWGLANWFKWTKLITDGACYQHFLLRNGLLCLCVWSVGNNCTSTFAVFSFSFLIISNNEVKFLKITKKMCKRIPKVHCCFEKKINVLLRYRTKMKVHAFLEVKSSTIHREP